MYLRNGVGLDLAGVSNVWATAQVNEGPAAINSGGGCGYLLVNYPQLEFIVLRSRKKTVQAHTLQKILSPGMELQGTVCSQAELHAICKLSPFKTVCGLLRHYSFPLPSTLDN